MEGQGGSAPAPPPLQAKEVPGVKVFRSSATMYFANAELYSDSLKKKVRLGSPCMVCVPEGLNLLIFLEYQPPPPACVSSAAWMSTALLPRKRNESKSRR